ncbi:hypothetical protein XA68_15125 [Ophiocordyceps unilateralis]|uniref:Uncharacterized protein n=1 Tax=Ophiocordyceps unilateralis TaxID=268505 RepID=A0A2A9P927_OPHUN|nr:hypothetical protein XA68_15125 [Ophiocordyceps unilateralis]
MVRPDSHDVTGRLSWRVREIQDGLGIRAKLISPPKQNRPTGGRAPPHRPAGVFERDGLSEPCGGTRKVMVVLGLTNSSQTETNISSLFKMALKITTRPLPPFLPYLLLMSASSVFLFPCS